MTALEDVEVNVAGTSIKGVWIGILLSFGSSLAAGIYASAEFFARLEALEEAVQGAEQTAAVLDGKFDMLADTQNGKLQEYQVSISGMEQTLQDNDIAQLGAKLAELGTQLDAIVTAQGQLLDMRERIATIERTNGETVITVKNKVEALERSETILKRVNTEIENLWEALDSLPFSSE